MGNKNDLNDNEKEKKYGGKIDSLHLGWEKYRNNRGDKCTESDLEHD